MVWTIELSSRAETQSLDDSRQLGQPRDHEICFALPISRGANQNRSRARCGSPLNGAGTIVNHKCVGGRDAGVGENPVIVLAAFFERVDPIGAV